MSESTADPDIAALRARIAQLEAQLEEREKTITRLESARHLVLSQLADTLEPLPVGIYLFGPDGRSILSNAVGRQYMGGGIPSREQVTRSRWVSLDAEGNPVPPEHWPGARALRGERVDPGMEFSFDDEQGGRQWLLISAVPYRIPWDGSMGGIAVLRNITPQKQAQESLRESIRRRDQFLAVLAHELRNPLAPLQSGLDVLRLPHSSAETVRNAQQIMQRQLDHLVRLVDDLLDVARIGRGDIPVHRAAIDLHAVCEAAMEGCRSLLEKRGHEFTFHPCDGAAMVDGDFHRLTQVVGNLVSNAAKYTDRGGRVDVYVRVAQGSAQVVVRDNGRGISSEHLGDIFEMFNRGSDPQAAQGLGLGLAISRQIVAMHDGTIEVRSSGLGRGSEFVVRLPQSAGSATRDPSEPAAPSDADSTWRVLVVDDNASAADTLGSLLQLQGHVVEVRYDGASALDAARGFDADVVLLDIGLPDTSGYHVASAIRGRPGGQRPVLIAVSGWGREADKVRALKAGFDHHVTKPLRLEMLAPLVREAWQRRAGITPD